MVFIAPPSLSLALLCATPQIQTRPLLLTKAFSRDGTGCLTCLTMHPPLSQRRTTAPVALSLPPLPYFWFLPFFAVYEEELLPPLPPALPWPPPFFSFFLYFYDDVDLHTHRLIRSLWLNRIFFSYYLLLDCESYTNQFNAEHVHTIARWVRYERCNDSVVITGS